MAQKKYYTRYRKVTDLYCLRKEKKRLFSKMVLYSNKMIEYEGSLSRIKSDDHFFEESDNKKYSCFSTNDYDNNMLMTRGYASTALFFLKILSSSESKYLNACYIYPCLFCFRHYVELTLKDTLWHYNRSGAEVDVMALNDEHNLACLWDKLLPLVGKKEEKIHNVGRLIHELSDVDKSGTAFRYGYYFSKEERIPSEPLNMRIDNKLLYTRMLQLYSFLEGLNDEIVCGYDEITSYNI